MQPSCNSRGYHLPFRATKLHFCDVTMSSIHPPAADLILKMPDSDYMNQVQLSYFKDRLEQLRFEITSNAQTTGEHLKVFEETPDPADRATQEETRTLELKTRDRERKLLKKVEAAIRRIDKGEYGYCEETGEPIGLERLMARPTATLCIEAQVRHEIRERHFHH